MAKILAYSVYDTKGRCFDRPFYVPTRGMAVRAFGDAVADPNSPFSKHAEDYILYEVGDFDTDTGMCVALPVPINLGHASDFLPAVPNVPLTPSAPAGSMEVK